MMTEDSLTSRTSSGVLWMTAQKWASRIGGLLAIIILTRVLSPESFGLAAAATTMMPLLYVLADVGFTTYIIQSEKAEPRTLNTAFWFSVVSGLALAGIVMGAAPLVGIALRLPEVVPLLQAMSVSVIVIAIASVPMALMRRRMAFRSLAVMEVSASLTAQAVAITAALLGAGAWALVLQAMVSQVVVTIWVWVAVRWRPGREFSIREFRTIGSFGVKVLGSELVGVARAWIETAIIISGLGVREMGYVNIAQRLVQTAQDLSVAALAPVSMVAFSQVRDEPERLRSSYVRASSIAHAVVAPLMVFVAVAAPILVPFLFGADKAPSAVIVPALAAVFLISVGWPIDQGLHIGMGKPGHWLALIGIAYTASTIMLAVGVQFGLAVLLGLWVAGALVESAIRWVAVSRLIDVSLWQAARPLIGVMGPTAIAAAAGLGLMRVLHDAPALLALSCIGIAVVGIYLVALRFLRTATFTDTVHILPGRLSRFLRWTLPRHRPPAAARTDHDDQPHG